MQIGAARVRAGCIGAVVTHPDHRRQGVGSALMWDAIDHARTAASPSCSSTARPTSTTRSATSTSSTASITISPAPTVLAQPPSPYRVRPATPDDAPALLELYQRHYGPYSGSFARTLEAQRYVTRCRRGGRPISLSPARHPALRRARAGRGRAGRAARLPRRPLGRHTLVWVRGRGRRLARGAGPAAAPRGPACRAAAAAQPRALAAPCRRADILRHRRPPAAP